MIEFESVFRAPSIRSLPAQSPSQEYPGFWVRGTLRPQFHCLNLRGLPWLMFSKVINADYNTLL